VRIEAARGTSPGRETPEPPELRRLRVAAGLFLAVIFTGFLGYQVIEGISPLDALYMTLITVTTVGFGEVADFGLGGKILTIGLIVAGVGSATYAAVTAMEFVVEGHLKRYLERRRMHRELDELQDHVIVCGFGRVGRHLADQLAAEGDRFVVVESDDVKVTVLDELGYKHVRGDATEEVTLHAAGLERCRALVACVNSDADNVLITLTAKGLSPDTNVIARSKAEENEAKLRRAGADRVIAPATIGGRRIAQILTRPVVADFLDGTGLGSVDYSLEEVPVRDGSMLATCTLREAGVRERFGCTVLGIRKADSGQLVKHPQAEDRLEAGDVLVVMGSETDVSRMREQFT
jgi:voltage-gated potassium channel